ncbi:hypothetical protein I4U23_011525 [Adineta vaga]|nr:hypothetical protein I4U23_011525 [Adineta vaga]
MKRVQLLVKYIEKQVEEKNQIESPFSRTLGFIRWNSPYINRISLMEKYRPFFYQLHYSIPNYTSKLNYTFDGLVSISCPYKMVSEIMTIILETYSQINGLLFFHFDAWINPFKFQDMNFENIWFLDGPLPPFKCVTTTDGWNWWAWSNGFHNIAKAATVMVAKNYSGRYKTDPNVFCGGWSDIYYIPRRFFKVFIDLANIFHSFDSFHEVAVPTIVNIIDLNYRLTPHHSVITKLSDCWGSCCASGVQPNDIKSKKCGHRMDLANEQIMKTFIELLDSQVIHLNKSILNKPN